MHPLQEYAGIREGKTKYRVYIGLSTPLLSCVDWSAEVEVGVVGTVGMGEFVLPPHLSPDLKERAISSKTL
jgi:hypothetical protein